MTVSSVDNQNSLLSDLSIKNQETDKTEKDKDMFMRLMLAQLENQNPLEPQDGTEFLAQLAQFSTVEGIGNLNTAMDDMNGMFRSNQALQATALVGRDVLVSGNDAYLDDQNNVSGVVHTDGLAASDVRMTIKSATGEVMRQIELGNIGSEDTTFEWNGTDAEGNRLPVGLYNMEITGRSGGEETALRTSTYANVNSVSVVNNKGDMLLNLKGLGQISSDNIQQVR